MKRLQGRKLAVLFITGLLCILSCAPVTCMAEGTKTIVVGVPTDRFPLTYTDGKTGNITGIGVDILNLAAENAGYQMEYVSLGSETIKQALDDERFDLVMPLGSAVDSELGNSSIITLSLFESPFVFAVIKGKSINTSDNLNVGMIKSMAGVGDTVHEIYPNYQIAFFDDWDQAVKGLRNGSVNGLLTSAYLWSYYLQKPSWQDLETLPVSAMSMPYYAGAVSNEKNQLLISQLNQGINMISATQHQSIILEYTSRDLYEYTFSDYVYQYRNLLLFTAALLILLIIGIYSITKQRKKYLDNVLAVNAQLEAVNQKLQTNAKEEKELRKQADAANEAKSEFLSRMSHDIRTPLNGIIGLTYLANEQKNPEQTKEYLDKIDTSSKFLLGLVNEILDISRAESDAIELHPEPYYLEDFNHYIDSVIRPLVEQKNQTLVFETHTVDGIVPLMDVLLINQIYFNLLSNAVKYTPEGGRITVTLNEQLTEKNKLRITVSVKDNGIGMSESFQQKLFEPFTQEIAEGEVERHGTGLGLAIVKRNIDKLGGQIAVHSKLGKGTEFVFVVEYNYIKGQRSRPKPAVIPTADPDAVLAGKHILVCEDNHINQEIVRTLLEEKKCVVKIVENGELGVSEFNGATPEYWDIILMDIHMPVMDGYEAARKIRASNKADSSTVTIIAMTADAFTEDMQKCLDAGMNGHIAKPVDPKKLYELLDQYISK